MDSLKKPLLCVEMQKYKGPHKLPREQKRAEPQYSPPRLDMFGDLPPPTYADAEDNVVCVGELVVAQDTDTISENEDNGEDAGNTNEDEDEDDAEDLSEDEEDDPIVIVEHKVQKHDTLQGIALRYRTSVRCPQYI